MTNATAKSASMTDRKILRTAVVESFWKLNPRIMSKNPVMFVVEVGAVITLVVLVANLAKHVGGFWFGLQITLWLWFTVLFANFAEAMAEGRGKAQAETLRKARAETDARKLREDGKTEIVASSKLRAGDIVLVSAGEFIPGDGEVMEGVASVDESAITGESAPVIRESGGDRSAVTGGTRVLSDEIKVRITSNPGETFLVGNFVGSHFQRSDYHCADSAGAAGRQIPPAGSGSATAAKHVHLRARRRDRAVSGDQGD